METPRYIFVDSGNNSGIDAAFQTTAKPTPGDLERADVGLVVIIRLADFHFYGPAKRWLPLARGVVLVPPAECSDRSPMHFHLTSA